MRSAVLVLLAMLFWSRTAYAERDLIVPFEEGGHVVVDQLAGMQVDAVSGVGFAGPVGIAFHDDESDGDNGTKTTTVWLAPSADVFVLEHLSLGGTIEVAHTWGSVKSAGQKLELPPATTLAFVPRVGFYVPVSDRIGIWPRAGFGWTSVETGYVANGAPAKDTFKALVLEADLGVVYRFEETFFLKAGPSLSTTLGGEHTNASGSSLHVAGVIGLGMNIEL